MVSSAFQKLDKHEVDALFSHFDKKGLGKITLKEFKLGLNLRASLESKMRFYLHDFMTPLQTLLKRNRISASDTFDLFVTKQG
jgi:EF-hand domain pair